MARTIVLVGHCGPDSSYLRMTVSAAEKGVRVISADDDESLQAAIAGGADLLLLNRVLDYGFPEEMGADLVRRIKAAHPDLKMMLVSNYEEAQAQAVAAGALPGFGKRELGTARVTQLIRDVLAASAHQQRAGGQAVE